jgi:hypothetical protein
MASSQRPATYCPNGLGFYRCHNRQTCRREAYHNQTEEATPKLTAQTGKTKSGSRPPWPSLQPEMIEREAHVFNTRGAACCAAICPPRGFCPFRGWGGPAENGSLGSLTELGEDVRCGFSYPPGATPANPGMGSLTRQIKKFLANRRGSAHPTDDGAIRHYAALRARTANSERCR